MPVSLKSSRKWGGGLRDDPITAAKENTGNS